MNEISFFSAGICLGCAVINATVPCPDFFSRAAAFGCVLGAAFCIWAGVNAGSGKPEQQATTYSCHQDPVKSQQTNSYYIVCE